MTYEDRRRLFAALLDEVAAEIPIPVVTGGHYLPPLKIGKKKKKQPAAVPFEQRRESVRQSLLDAMVSVEEWQDEEDLIAILHFDN